MLIIFIILIPLLAAAIASSTLKGAKNIEKSTTISSSIVFVLSLFVANAVLKNQSYSFTEYFSVSSFGAIVLLLTSFVGMIVSFFSIGYLRTEVKKNVIGFKQVRHYHLLLNLFLMTMFLAATLTSPILTWVAVEATTLSTAFLISFYNKPSSIEAAWKYLLINSVGLLLAFFGTLLFLSNSSLSGHGLTTWNNILSVSKQLNPAIIKIAFIFILIGYGTKMGLVPMHTWLPDAHSKAPAPISSLLSGVLLNIALFTILRFKTITDSVVGAGFTSSLFIYFGLFSIVLSALFIFLQTNYKRLLAYSTIEHMGLIALGFGFGDLGIFAAILHMIYHSLAKPLLFLTSGNIFLKFSSTKIEKIKGVFTAIPTTGILFFVGLLAITGTPPFGIFLTEISILSAGIKAHPYIIAIVLMALSLIFIGFLKHGTSMLYGEKPEEIKVGEAGKWNIYPLVIMATVLIVLSLYLPSSLKILIDRATSIL